MCSDEEVDYMSDAFLESMSGKQDVRPGLLKSHAEQYNHNQAVNKLKTDVTNRARNPSFKERESVSRENALNKPLDEDNKGYKILQKYGFKPGSGLGRSGEGRVEPIRVEVKTDRQGLGRKSSLEAIAQLRAKFKAEAREKMLNVNDYRTRKAAEAAERSAALDLMKSQRVCWELDSKESIEEPADIWFWPEKKLPTKNEDSDDETGVENQPASSSKLESSGREEGSGEDENDEEEEKEEEFSVSEKLEMLTLYLRRTHLYCVWCGHSFLDEKDLQQECPGPTRDDH